MVPWISILASLVRVSGYLAVLLGTVLWMLRLPLPRVVGLAILCVTIVYPAWVWLDLVMGRRFGIPGPLLWFLRVAAFPPFLFLLFLAMLVLFFCVYPGGCTLAT